MEWAITFVVVMVAGVYFIELRLREIRDTLLDWQSEWEEKNKNPLDDIDMF